MIHNIRRHAQQSYAQQTIFTPYLKNRECVEVTVCMVVQYDAWEMDQNRTIFEVEAFSKSAISYWALGIYRLSDAFSVESFATLQKLLLAIESIAYYISQASVVSVAPLLSPTKQLPTRAVTGNLIEKVNSTDELLAFEDFVADRYPKLRANPEAWQQVQILIEQKRISILSEED
jgi:hypothetical protein